MPTDEQALIAALNLELPDPTATREFDHTGTGNLKADWTHEPGSVVYYRRTQQIQKLNGDPIGQFLAIPPGAIGPKCWKDHYADQYGWRWLNAPWPNEFKLVVVTQFAAALNTPESWFKDNQPVLQTLAPTPPAGVTPWKVYSSTDNPPQVALGYMWLKGAPVVEQVWLLDPDRLVNNQFLKNQLTFIKAPFVQPPPTWVTCRNAVVAHPTAPADRVCTNV